MQAFKLLLNLHIANKGTIGICIGEYSWGSKYILFENGGFDGFNYQEQHDMLQEIKDVTLIFNYEFKNVMQVSTDFNNGKFKHIFEKCK